MNFKIKNKSFNLPEVLEMGEHFGAWYYIPLDYRKPKKDEYFVSGAIPEIYKAENNISYNYLIIKLTSKAVHKEIWVPEQLKDQIPDDLFSSYCTYKSCGMCNQQ